MSIRVVETLGDDSLSGPLLPPHLENSGLGSTPISGDRYVSSSGISSGTSISKLEHHQILLAISFLVLLQQSRLTLEETDEPWSSVVSVAGLAGLVVWHLVWSIYLIASRIINGDQCYENPQIKLSSELALISEQYNQAFTNANEHVSWCLPLHFYLAYDSVRSSQSYEAFSDVVDSSSPLYNLHQVADLQPREAPMHPAGEMGGLSGQGNHDRERESGLNPEEWLQLACNSQDNNPDRERELQASADSLVNRLLDGGGQSPWLSCSLLQNDIVHWSGGRFEIKKEKSKISQDQYVCQYVCFVNGKPYDAGMFQQYLHLRGIERPWEDPLRVPFKHVFTRQEMEEAINARLEVIRHCTQKYKDNNGDSLPTDGDTRIDQDGNVLSAKDIAGLQAIISRHDEDWRRNCMIVEPNGKVTADLSRVASIFNGQRAKATATLTNSCTAEQARSVNKMLQSNNEASHSSAV